MSHTKGHTTLTGHLNIDLNMDKDILTLQCYDISLVLWTQKLKKLHQMLRPGCGWKNTIVNSITLKVNTYISKIGPINFSKETKNETIY